MSEVLIVTPAQPGTHIETCDNLPTVIPAQAGTHVDLSDRSAPKTDHPNSQWIPAYAGKTLAGLKLPLFPPVTVVPPALHLTPQPATPLTVIPAQAGTHFETCDSLPTVIPAQAGTHFDFSAGKTRAGLKLSLSPPVAIRAPALHPTPQPTNPLTVIPALLRTHVDFSAGKTRAGFRLPQCAQAAQQTSQNILEQITPSGVELLNQAQFPRPLPLLQRPLARNSHGHLIMQFIPNQHLDTVATREPVRNFQPMLCGPQRQVGSHTNVERAPARTSHNIDSGLHHGLTNAVTGQLTIAPNTPDDNFLFDQHRIPQSTTHLTVIPAHAGTHFRTCDSLPTVIPALLRTHFDLSDHSAPTTDHPNSQWIPAYAGKTLAGLKLSQDASVAIPMPALNLTSQPSGPLTVIPAQAGTHFETCDKLPTVIPAQAGTHFDLSDSSAPKTNHLQSQWIPAYAGKTLAGLKLSQDASVAIPMPALNLTSQPSDPLTVIPAQAGTHFDLSDRSAPKTDHPKSQWIPARAGKTLAGLQLSLSPSGEVPLHLTPQSTPHLTFIPAQAGTHFGTCNSLPTVIPALLRTHFDLSDCSAPKTDHPNSQWVPACAGKTIARLRQSLKLTLAALLLTTTLNVFAAAPVLEAQQTIAQAELARGAALIQTLPSTVQSTLLTRQQQAETALTTRANQLRALSGDALAQALSPAARIDSELAPEPPQRRPLAASRNPGNFSRIAPEPADLLPTLDAPITPEITALANQLGGPVAIFEHVRKNIAFVPSQGSLQGALGVLSSQRANAMDTASLLISLLRAKGIHARYLHGQVTLDAIKLQRWLGVDSISAVTRLFTAGGIPYEPVLIGGQVGALTFAHTWVEAWVDFVPSRGAQHRNSAADNATVGDAWVGLDASYKELDYQPGVDFGVLMALDAQASAGAISAASSLDAAQNFLTSIGAEAVGLQMQAATARLNQALSVQGLTNTRLRELFPHADDATPNYPYFLGSLAYQVQQFEVPTSTLTSADRLVMKLTIQQEENGATGQTVLSLEQPTAALFSQQLSLRFRPATATDAAVLSGLIPSQLSAFSGLPESIPAYLVQMQGELALDGVRLSQTPALRLGLGLVATQTLTRPDGSSSRQQWSAVVGETRVLSLDVHGGLGGHISRASSALSRTALEVLSPVPATQSAAAERLGTELLQMNALAHFAASGAYQSWLAGPNRVVFHRAPSLSTSGVSLEVSAPLGLITAVYPVGFSVSDVSPDHLAAALNRGDVARFAQESLIAESAFGHLLLEQLFAPGLSSQLGQGDGRSAGRVYTQSLAAAAKLYTFGSSQVSQLSALNLPSLLQTPLTAALARGDQITVNSTALTLAAQAGSVPWKGYGATVNYPNGLGGTSFIVGNTRATAGNIRTGASVSSVLARGLALNAWLGSNTPPRLLSLMPSELQRALAAGDSLRTLANAPLEIAPSPLIRQIIAATVLHQQAGPLVNPLIDQHLWLALLAPVLSISPVLDSEAPNVILSATSPINLGQASQISAAATDNFGDGTSNIIDLGDDLGPVDPSRYKLTTEDGMVYILDQDFGVRQIQDQAGNTVTYTDNGIVHSSGTRVDFVRDAQKRITDIVLPDGRRLKYSYDAKGDLIRAADPADLATTYGYVTNIRYPHYLKDITDARGIRAIRHEYDDDGRLVKTIDADGNPITYTHNIAGKTEIIKNRRGFSTVYTYDANGWVLLEKNSLGEEKTWTYDQNGSVLSQTDGLNRKTEFTVDPRGNPLTEKDALGKITTRTWGYYNQLYTETDAIGRVTTNKYFRAGGEDLGYAIESKNPAGEKVSVSYDLCGASTSCSNTGNVRAMIDPAGARTSFIYTRQGQTARSTNAVGQSLRYEYDAMGRNTKMIEERATSSGTPELLTTQYFYNAKGELIKTIAPDGAISLTEYNAIGKPTKFVDPQGRTTLMEYDNRGALSKKSYADNTFETYQYDADGLTIGMTDRLGRTTKNVYDGADRLVSTIFPDATADPNDNPKVINQYDAAGQLIKETDEAGSTYEYKYDLASRPIETIDPYGNSTRMTYDDIGQRTSSIDPVGQVTRYEYDGARRLVKVTLPDGTPADTDNPTRLFSYDGQSNKTSETDELGRVTRYAYNALGQLLRVVKPNPSTGANPVLIDNESPPNSGTLVTKYSYDAQGNIVSVIDGNGNETKVAYDELSRPISKTLPLGQRMSMEYFSDGNLKAMTNYRGQRTTYDYDLVNGWLTKVNHADGRVAEFSYQGNGLKIEEKLTQGTQVLASMAYKYDERGRMISSRQADVPLIPGSQDSISISTTSMATWCV